MTEAMDRIWRETPPSTAKETETLDKLYLEWSQYTQARTRRELLLLAALRSFADHKNWSDEPGNLQWLGKRHAVEFAKSVLDQSSL